LDPRGEGVGRPNSDEGIESLAFCIILWNVATTKNSNPDKGSNAKRSRIGLEKN
jgi:hypothetical protein